METITINIDEKIAAKFRKIVREHIGNSKGTLSKAVSEALKKWIEEIEQEKLKQRSIERLTKGYKLGKILYKKREDLYN